MSEEIKETLDDIKRHLDYVESTKQSSIRDNEMKIMYNYITSLQQKVEQLEKENKELRQPQVFIDCEDMEERYGRDLYEDYLKGKIEQLENIRKEAIKWVVNHKEELHHSFDEPDWDYLLYGNATDLLNILNKGDNKE